MISSVKAKRFFVGCTNINARLTSILMLKKVEELGQVKAEEGGGGEIYFSPWEMCFSPYLPPSCWCLPLGLIYPLPPIFLSGKRELKQRQRWRQREWQKSNRLGWQNNNSARASRLFGTFLCRHCTTTTWICLISRFLEDVNTRRRLSFPFRECRYSLWEFNSGKNSQHLTNSMRWNKRYKGWSNVNSLFKK